MRRTLYSMAAKRDPRLDDLPALLEKHGSVSAVNRATGIPVQSIYSRIRRDEIGLPEIRGKIRGRQFLPDDELIAEVERYSIVVSPISWLPRKSLSSVVSRLASFGVSRSCVHRRIKRMVLGGEVIVTDNPLAEIVVQHDCKPDDVRLLLHHNLILQHHLHLRRLGMTATLLSDFALAKPQTAQVDLCHDCMNKLEALALEGLSEAVAELNWWSPESLTEDPDRCWVQFSSVYEMANLAAWETMPEEFHRVRSAALNWAARGFDALDTEDEDELLEAKAERASSYLDRMANAPRSQ
jgi:hypothetical protein